MATRAHPLLPEDTLRPPMDDFGDALGESVAVTPATIGIAKSPLLFAGPRATEPWLVKLPPAGTTLPFAVNAADAAAAAPGRDSSRSDASRDVPDSERLATAAAAAARVPSLSELLDLFFICSDNVPRACWHNRKHEPLRRMHQHRPRPA